jgi:hypothetical protein
MKKFKRFILKWMDDPQWPYWYGHYGEKKLITVSSEPSG